MADADPRIDALIQQMAQLTSVVGTLAASIAQQADAGDGVPTTDVSHIHMTQDAGYAPLVELSDENEHRRFKMAHRLNLFGTPAGDEMIAHGARGFYRKLEREPGKDRLEIPGDIARALIEDATLEDTREAIEMGHDLLKVWDEFKAIPQAGIDAPDVAL